MADFFKSLIMILTFCAASTCGAQGMQSLTYPAGDSASVSSSIVITPTERKRCCITYLTGHVISTSSSPNSYSEADKTYSCPPGYVGTTVRHYEDPGVYGIYCKEIKTSCEWVDKDDTSISKTVTFYYWQDDSWKTQSDTVTAQCPNT
jgi:hypothetical protein